MERFTQLNLRRDSEPVEPANLSKPEQKEPEPPVMGKRVNRIINKAAHKAASEFGRNRGGLFSK